MSSAKKPLALVLGIGKAKPMHDEPDGDEEESDDAAQIGRDAAQEMIDAITAKDPDRLYEAFRAMRAACDDDM